MEIRRLRQQNELGNHLRGFCSCEKKYPALSITLKESWSHCSLYLWVGNTVLHFALWWRVFLKPQNSRAFPRSSVFHHIPNFGVRMGPTAAWHCWAQPLPGCVSRVQSEGWCVGGHPALRSAGATLRSQTKSQNPIQESSHSHSGRPDASSSKSLA